MARIANQLPNYKWMKLSYSYLDQRDFMGLSDSALATFIKLYLLACKADSEGLVADIFKPLNISDIAWIFRRSDEEIKLSIDELIKSGLLFKDEDGYTIKNFLQEQGPGDNEQREKWRINQSNSRAKKNGKEPNEINVELENKNDELFLQIYKKVTDLDNMVGKDEEKENAIKIIERIFETKCTEDEEKTVEYLKPYFKKMISQINKNGIPYSKTFLFWLDYADAGVFPGDGKPPQVEYDEAKLKNLYLEISEELHLDEERKRIENQKIEEELLRKKEIAIEIYNSVTGICHTFQNKNFEENGWLGSIYQIFTKHNENIDETIEAIKPYYEKWISLIIYPSEKKYDPKSTQWIFYALNEKMPEQMKKPEFSST